MIKLDNFLEKQLEKYFKLPPSVLAFSLFGRFVSSGLNSLAAVTWQDFFAKVSFFQKLNDRQQGRVTKVIGLAYGVLTIGFGFAAGSLGGVLKAALVLNGTVAGVGGYWGIAGPLLGVFLLGVFMPFVNSKGAISGMLVSHAISLTIGFGSLAFGNPAVPLPASIDHCSNSTLAKVANLTAVYVKQQHGADPLPPVEGWNRVFNLSYLLYPVVGTSITIIVGAIVSLLTGPSEMTKDDEKYIHPLLVKIIKKFRSSMPTTVAPVSYKNEHEMSWRNGAANNAQLAWTTNGHTNGASLPVVNGDRKPIRIGAYDNVAYDNS